VAPHELEERLVGTLLGTALGDALGLPAEGLPPRVIDRQFGRIDRFRLLGRTGFVSDDTEQTALLAQSLIRQPADIDRCVEAFRRCLLGWFCRLPWRIGWATLRSCMRIALGISPSGVRSAGNGAAMRAGILGAFFYDQLEVRQAFGRAIAEVTHRDERAIEGAIYVAEIAAACVGSPLDCRHDVIYSKTRLVVRNPQLGSALDQARDLAGKGVGTSEAAKSCGTSGFVVHTVSFATFIFLRYADDPLFALTEAISAGGDTDSIGAIVGGWLGARHGARLMPGELLDRIHDGPFGPTHLRALGAALSLVREGEPCPVPGYSTVGALGRNLVMYPVILGLGFRRLIPL
jgi:ADP-ribosyl-[dinitrogen reductase] hydrolase